MIRLGFEWDEIKNGKNKKKHGVSFEEAGTVFYDDNARLILDEDHSENEERFILMGMSFNLNILVVIHSYTKTEEIIRIISARRATKKESKQYEECLK